MDAIKFHQLAKVVRIVLTTELFLGGQARLTSALTPGLHKRAMAKAEGAQRYLDFIPIRDARQHTRFIGLLMCSAGALLSWQKTRLAGGLLSIALSLAGVYTQTRMQIPYWLPTTNTVLAGIVIWEQIAARSLSISRT